MISTEILTSLIDFSRREDLQYLEGIRNAQAAFNNGELDSALLSLCRVPNLKDLVGDQLFKVVEQHYCSLVLEQIESDMKEHGYFVAHSDDGYSYTVGLAQNGAELFVVHNDFSTIEQAKAVIEGFAGIPVGTEEALICLADMPTYVLVRPSDLKRDRGGMLYADSWWEATDYPVLRILPVRDGASAYLDGHLIRIDSLPVRDY